MPPSSPSKNLQALRRRSSSPDGIDLALARRRGARHHRAERRRQDHAVRHHAAGTVAPDAGRVLVRRRRHHPRCRRGSAARMGIARSFQIPQPFGGMTRVREPRRCRRLRRPARASATSIDALHGHRSTQCGLADKANRQCRQPHADRPQAARTRARARDRPARAPARRGRRRAHRARMPRRWSHLIKDGAPQRRVDHLDRARRACAARRRSTASWCCTAARFIAEGDPHDGDPPARRCAEIYMGIAADA